MMHAYILFVYAHAPCMHGCICMYVCQASQNSCHAQYKVDKVYTYISREREREGEIEVENSLYA